ncbi:3-phosphoshikimate 1-carboxyvinyltransferase [Lachnospiraceae bacterium ZAX-1]
MQIRKASYLKGEVSIPGDKSISHRGIMFGAISNGLTEITNFLQGADCLSTISCFEKLGIQIQNKGNTVYIHGKGLHGLAAPSKLLDVGNSGTTIRLISGILCGQSFKTTLTGDFSIQKRPMNRIFTPLSMMGAQIESLAQENFAPFTIHGSTLAGIHYYSPVASAQVKSAVLLAGLYGDSTTKVTEPVASRNHTELMLSAFGATVTVQNKTASIEPNPMLSGQKIEVPGDISSAAYFIVAGLIMPNSEILIQNVGINSTRDGMIRVARNMGGNLTFLNKRMISGEPVADLLVTSSSLHGITICGDIIPTLIDEIPAIAVMAAFAEGETIIKDAQELKVKESNRIDSVVNNLTRMGAKIKATDDGMVIDGGPPLRGCEIETNADHRIAMSFAVAGLAAQGDTILKDGECVTVSYPKFYQDLMKLGR